MRDFLRIVSLLLLMSLTASRAQYNSHPAKEIDLHNHADWRVGAQIEFDPTGRLLILCRDNSSLRAHGNWHLIRLSGPLSEKPLQEEITFSIPQEPLDPEMARRWDDFHTSLLLSPDGRHAYATFNGTVVTPKPGPPPTTGGRSVNIDLFSSVISFDLTAFRLLASADITQHPTNSNVHLLDGEGNLLLLHPTDTDWKVQALDRLLQEVKTVTIPMSVGRRFDCYLRPDLNMECPGSDDAGNLVLSQQTTVHLPKSPCQMRQETVALGFGKEVTLDDERRIRSDRVCARNESGGVERVSLDILPRCHQGWQPAAISPDGNSLLTSCFEPGSFLDAFFYTSSASLQFLDAHTLIPQATIPLTTRHRLAYTVFHHAVVTAIAVLEDGAKLKLYTFGEGKNTNPPALARQRLEPIVKSL